MELREYAAVLRRRWRWWAACLLVGLLLAGALAAFSPRAWTAQTQVFVSGTQDGTASSQFVQQRVKSYPDVATSAEVLAPVRDELGLDVSLNALRRAVTATNPADTSQITISVEQADPDLAARIADAVAEEFSTAVERLETTDAGTSPVSLTVTNPATVPETPSSPQVSLLLALGLVCGAGLGLAGAVLRDRWDRRVWSATDVQAAWGGATPEVLSPPTRREPADRAAQVLARRIERRTATGTVRLLLVSPSAAGSGSVHQLVHDLGRVLTARELRVATRADDDSPSEVELVPLSADAALSHWRTAVLDADGVVVVCPAGSADRTDVFELAQLLESVSATVVAVVLTSRTRGRRTAVPGPELPEPPSGGDRIAVPAVRAVEGLPTRKVKGVTRRRSSATMLGENVWGPLTPEGPGAPAASAEPADAADVLPQPGDGVVRGPRVAGARRTSVAAATPRREITVTIPPGGAAPSPRS